MPTTVVNTIGTGGDYTDLASWEADATDLVAADQVWQGQVLDEELSGGTSTALTIAGQTTDATRYMELTTQAGASFADNAGVRTNGLRYNASNGAAITAAVYVGFTVIVQTAFTRLSKLQIRNTDNSGGGLLVQTAATVLITQCIIQGIDKILEFGNATDGLILDNCLLIKAGTGTSGSIRASGGSSAIILRKCTIIRPTNFTAGGTGVLNEYGGITATGCLFIGFTTPVNFSSGTISFCSTDQTGFGETASDSNVSVTPTTELEEPSAATALDCRLKSGATSQNDGTAVGVAIDISGLARPSGAAYDIGAWEIEEGGGGGSDGTDLPRYHFDARPRFPNTRAEIARREAGPYFIDAPNSPILTSYVHGARPIRRPVQAPPRTWLWMPDRLPDADPVPLSDLPQYWFGVRPRYHDPAVLAALRTQGWRLVDATVPEPPPAPEGDPTLPPLIVTKRWRRRMMSRNPMFWSP